MRTTRMNKIVCYCLLATSLIVLTNCISTSGNETEWQKKNKELIAKYNLTEKELSELPKTTIASNLEPAKVTRMAAYHAIIPENAKLELVVDGKKTKPELYFSEGPKWMNGKVYFSNMYFDQNFNANPKKSSIVEMDPDGKYRNICKLFINK